MSSYIFGCDIDIQLIDEPKHLELCTEMFVATLI